ncbi:GIY-YIG nuclease family protein [Niabella yanshanensis]|uniref:GIY-YIG nuclease family protein n=1 Tax=Niabella yanshanensis TaxID=577386 RepID=UPI000E0B4697
MMHYVYILFSQVTQRYYVGESAFPENRLAEHNTAKYAAASTRVAGDWVIRKLIQCKSRADALKIERYIKSMKSRKFIEQLINDPVFFANFKIIVKQRFDIEISG